jgi:hypothetical protein
MQGMTDAEYLWEPVSGCWSVRRRPDITTSRGFGAGEWQLEQENDPGDPAPFTTLAWRLTHLAMWMTIRADYTVGTKAMTWNDFVVPHTAQAEIAATEQAGAAWRGTMDGVTDAELDQIGRSSNPWGLDPQLPYIAIAWWVNQELLHHAAEIALLRDLYTQRDELGAGSAG